MSRRAAGGNYVYPRLAVRRVGVSPPDIEMYDSTRFVAMTGAHIQSTPCEIPDAQAFIDDLVAEFVTLMAGSPADRVASPAKPRAAVTVIETTTDNQNVFDAIQHMGSADIQLRSSVTEERLDRLKSHIVLNARRRQYWYSYIKFSNFRYTLSPYSEMGPSS